MRPTAGHSKVGHMMEDDFWTRPEVVAKFAARDPDLRLLALMDEYSDPGSTRVLDVGCAGGRNTVVLAEAGFDVHALDLSMPMVEAVRRRLAPIVGSAEADGRVRQGRMSALPYPAGSFDLVISFGVLHSARSWDEWKQAVRETHRVLRPRGRFLLSQFTPDTDFTGEGIHRVPGEPHLYEGLPAGRGILLEPPELDGAMRELGFALEAPTTTGTTVMERGRRVSVNGLFLRSDPRRE